MDPSKCLWNANGHNYKTLHARPITYNPFEVILARPGRTIIRRNRRYIREMGYVLRTSAEYTRVRSATRVTTTEENNQQLPKLIARM